MLSIQPGRKIAKNSGNQRASALRRPIANIPQKTARKSNFSQYVHRSNWGFGPLLKNMNHPNDILNIFQRGQRESGPKSFWRGLGLPEFLKKRNRRYRNGCSKITKSNGCADAVNQACHSAPPRKCIRPLAQGAWENLREACEDEANEGDHHREVKHKVKGTESAVHLTRFLWFHVLGEKDPFASVPPFPKVFSPPEKGMEPE